MIIRKGTLAKGIIVLLAVMVASIYIPTGYYLISPGTVQDLGQMVDVAGGEKTEGSINLVTVLSGRAGVLQLVYGLVHPNVDVEPRRRIVPEGFSEEQYREYLHSLMVDSQNTAKAVALEYLGYDVDIEPQGVKVINIFKDSPAEGRLMEGDIITGVDGEQVITSDDLVSHIRGKNTDEVLELRVRRGDRMMQVEITPTLIDGMTAIGITYQPLPWTADFPIDIAINTGEIGGPSAGTMLTLEIIDQLTPEDLTQGRKIAGTGTISLDGLVGGIGGINQKILAALEAGADVFFYPEGNEPDIRVRPSGLTLVPVRTLDEVVSYLKK